MIGLLSLEPKKYFSEWYITSQGSTVFVCASLVPCSESGTFSKLRIRSYTTDAGNLTQHVLFSVVDELFFENGEFSPSGCRK